MHKDDQCAYVYIETMSTGDTHINIAGIDVVMLTVFMSRVLLQYNSIVIICADTTCMYNKYIHVYSH